MEDARAQRYKRVAARLPFRFARKRKTDESGQSLVEFALMLPLLCLLLLGVVEVGRAIFITLAVNNAATAGVEYGSLSTSNASDTGGMKLSATCDANGSQCTGNMVNGIKVISCVCNATGILTSAKVTPTSGCVCDTGSGVSCAPAGWSSCPASCGSGQSVECVNVTTTATFNSLFNYPGLPSTFHANGNATMRVRGGQ